MILVDFLAVLASKMEIRIYQPVIGPDFTFKDECLFRGRCEVARENFPCDTYTVVYVTFKGSEGICKILVEERRRK